MDVILGRKKVWSTNLVVPVSLSPLAWGYLPTAKLHQYNQSCHGPVRHKKPSHWQVLLVLPVHAATIQPLPRKQERKASLALLPLDLPSGLLGLLWFSDTEGTSYKVLVLWGIPHPNSPFFLSESRCLGQAGFVLLEGFMGHHDARMVRLFKWGSNTVLDYTG